MTEPDQAPSLSVALKQRATQNPTYSVAEQLRVKPNVFTDEDQKEMDRLLAKRKAHNIREHLQSCDYFSLDCNDDRLLNTEIEDCIERAKPSRNELLSMKDGQHVVYGYTRRKYGEGHMGLLKCLAEGMEDFFDPEDPLAIQLQNMPDSVIDAAQELADRLREDWEPWACEMTRTFMVTILDGKIDNLEVVA